MGPALPGRAPLPYAVWPGFVARSLCLLVPFLHSAWAFIGVLATASLLGTMAEPANAAVLQRLYPRELRGRALGTVRMAAHAPWVLVVPAVTEGLMTSGLDMVWIIRMLDAAGPRRSAQYVAISATLAGVRGVLCPLASAAIIQVAAIVLLSAAIRAAAAAPTQHRDRSLAPAIPA